MMLYIVGRFNNHLRWEILPESMLYFIGIASACYFTYNYITVVGKRGINVVPHLRKRNEILSG